METVPRDFTAISSGTHRRKPSTRTRPVTLLPPTASPAPVLDTRTEYTHHYQLHDGFKRCKPRWCRVRGVSRVHVAPQRVPLPSHVARDTWLAPHAWVVSRSSRIATHALPLLTLP